MSAKSPQKTSQQKTSVVWKKSLIDVRQMLTERDRDAYRVARLLRDVYGDRDFIAHVDGDHERAVEMLDKLAYRLIGDVASGSPFADLMLMLQRYPHAEHWQTDAGLFEMYDVMMEEASQQEPPPKARKPANRVKRADFEKVTRERDTATQQRDQAIAEQTRLAAERRQIRVEVTQQRDQAIAEQTRLAGDLSQAEDNARRFELLANQLRNERDERPPSDAEELAQAKRALIAAQGVAQGVIDGLKTRLTDALSENAALQYENTELRKMLDEATAPEESLV
ncbi:MAG: hypothetical protein GY835_24635 [bacterium]|nr:hypothetical protein [bacterium]